MKNRPTTNYQLLTTNWRKLRLGLTLVELLTGFGVLGLVSIMVATLYFTHVRLFSNQNTSIDVATQNKLALDEIVAQIREGQAVVITCSACAGDTTSATILVLQLWPLDAAGDPIQPQGTAYDYIVYKRDAVDSTKLIKKTVADAASSRQSQEKIIARSLADLQFSLDNADPSQASEVTVSLTTTANVNGRVHTTSQSIKAVLRNK